MGAEAGPKVRLSDASSRDDLQWLSMMSTEADILRQ